PPGSSFSRSARLLGGKIGAIILFPIHVHKRRHAINSLVAGCKLERDPQRRASGPLETSALVIAAPVIAEHHDVETRESRLSRIVVQHTTQPRVVAALSLVEVGVRRQESNPFKAHP